MMKIEPRNPGFSLIELLFAMLFISLILFGVVRLETSNLGLSNTQNNQAKAHLYATQGVEIVRALGAASIAFRVSGPCGGNLPCPMALKKTGSTYSLDGDIPETIAGTIFYRTITVKSVTPAGPGPAFLVISGVQWDDSTGEHAAEEARRIVFSP